MKKSTLIGISILSVFILCSLSYNPILANQQIESIPIIDDVKTSDVDKQDLKELYSRLVKSKYQSDDDCDCEYNSTNVLFPILCDIIYPFLWNIVSPTIGPLIDLLWNMGYPIATLIGNLLNIFFGYILFFPYFLLC